MHSAATLGLSAAEPTTVLIICLTTCFAAFVQGVSGFGFALIAMPVLAGLTSIYVAAPLVALIMLTNNTLMSLYYHRTFNRAIVGQLLLGSIFGIPVGPLALQYLPAHWMLMMLGAVIVAYALYTLVETLAKPVTPSLQASTDKVTLSHQSAHRPSDRPSDRQYFKGVALPSQWWIRGAGFLSGILIGSYNIPGPPVIVYGNSQHWSQEKFKSNLTGFFWVNALLVIIGHGIQHRITTEVFQQYLITIPGLLIGLSAGITLSKSFNPLIFRRVILGILIVLGSQLFKLGMQS